LEQVIDVLLDPVGLIAVEIDISVQPPVQQRVAVVVGEADRAAGASKAISATRNSIRARWNKGLGRVKLFHIIQLFFY
jgi:hypothetical protein